MNEVFKSYFNVFLHPFDVHERLRTIRENMASKNMGAITIVSSDSEDQEDVPVKISFVEALSVSWFFRVIQTFYVVASVHVGVLTVQMMSDSADYENLLFPSFSFETFSQKLQVIFFIYTLMNTIFFPLTLLIYTKVWGVLIRFFASLFEVKGDVNEMTEEVVNHSLVSNTFLLVPVFGEVARFFSSLIYIFSGLRMNMSMSPLQCVVTLASPLFLVFLTFMIVALYILMAVNFL